MVPKPRSGGMCSFYTTLHVVLILLACVSTLAQIDPAAQPTASEASVSVAGLPVQGVATSAAGSIPSAVPVAPRQDASIVAQCQGVPATDSYTQTWSCTGTECTATCVPGAKAPYGPPKAVCTAGAWQPANPGCLAGGVYNFDDITQDGSLPTRFLGLIWSGLRVTNSQRFTACEGVSGFRYGIVSAPNVAYSLEVGASGDLTNLVRITAPSTASRISVLGFTATAAWQDGLRIDVSAWDVQDRQLALQAYQLSFFRPTVIDLRTDLRYSGIYRFQIITSGGQKVSCATGKQVVLDNFEVYIHGQ